MPRLYDSNDKPGKIKEWGGTTLPANHLWCDGSLYANTAYPELAAELGTTYNQTGDAAGYFRVPDRRGRAGIGANHTGLPNGRNASLAIRNPGDGTKTAIGAETHALAKGEIPSHTHSGTTSGQSQNHTHPFTDNTAYKGGSGTSNGMDYQPIDNTTADLDSTDYADRDHTHSITTDGGAGLSGGATGGAHNNMQPSLVTGFIIRY